MQIPRLATLAALIIAPASSHAQPAAPPISDAPSAATEELDPFTFADFTWQSGSARTKDSVLGNKYFTGEFRLDDVFHYPGDQGETA